MLDHKLSLSIHLRHQKSVDSHLGANFTRQEPVWRFLIDGAYSSSPPIPHLPLNIHPSKFS
uniref:Uncharacterized protein n=1 Tax=Daphnia magna TaxID=35525 RepID=A0A0P6H7W9_9CRUS